jgi:flavodoxin/ferredoxin
MPKLKTLIVYYSFSGNTRKIAHAINQGMGQFTEKNDIAVIKGSSGVSGLKPEDLLKYDIIGFGSPVWSHSPTPNMMSFIENLPYLNGKHAFFFVLHGVLPSGAVRWMAKALKSRGAIPIGWQDWYGSAYPADMYKPYHTDGHPDEIDLAEATAFGGEMIERSRRITAGETGLIPLLPTGKEYEKLYGRKPAYRAPLKRKDFKVRPFWLSHEIKINSEKCSQCKLCQENCPVGCIDLCAHPPIDKNTCIACWVCEQICPLGAIEIDCESIVKEREATSGKNWTKNKFFQKNVQRIENDPRFRRLIPLMEVGKKGYWYQISKHPRIKIPRE